MPETVVLPAPPPARGRVAPAEAHATPWAGPGGRRARRENFTWQRLLWRLILPERTPWILPTASGWMLLLVIVAVGLAAYNTGNNILFLTLALLLACLVLSGVLSWMNYARVAWRLRAAPPVRAGEETVVVVELRNDKRALPSWALSAELETAVTGATASLPLRTRLAPGGAAELRWTFRPAKRGREEVRLARVASLFPFGFLKKHLRTAIALELTVWPARVAYELAAEAPARWRPEQGRSRRGGGDADLLGLRRYQPGDSQRAVHWKASARLGQLLVRQHALETATQFALHVTTGAARWPRSEQFELLCRLAASLAEDLFRAGRLHQVAVDDEPALAVHRVLELETFLDRLALLAAGDADRASPAGGARARPAERGGFDPVTTLTFAPDGERGVVARLGGKVVARA